ncbi:response regulator (plasmid) [Paracoccus sp. MA]|uniref:response regulator n=1 Tax=Paracoccus sp. MA TaxID=2895796 RepID=UPI001E4190C4|nr:response regulator [Paracoccus sp. MA]UFM66918.1 response regulator [Paracoccus sp. MA]
MRILVVEDDYFLAEQLTTEILELGDSVVGPFADVHDAILCDDRIEAAILDVKLGDETSFCIADSLKSSGIPFLFLTGGHHELVPPRFRDARIYSKPSHARPMLHDLHAQHDRLPVRPSESIETIVVDMLVQAQRVMPDRASAERLVEAALKSAVAMTERGQAEQELKAWLLRLLGKEYAKRRRRHLN